MSSLMIDHISIGNRKTDHWLSRIIPPYKSLLKAYRTMHSEAESVAGERDDLKKRYDLVTSALSARPEHSSCFESFSRLFHDDFIDFINQIDVLSNEAENIVRMKAVEDKIRIIESFSRFKNKNVVAVAGGFSSGKSSFIASLFSHSDILLPVGIEPITAIPTYICHSDQSRIIGYTEKGGKITISPDLYDRLSHQYIEDFGFNLRDLIPFIAIETSLKGLDHIAFIDLPGYNPGSREGFTASDSNSRSHANPLIIR